ncbi:lysophospholipase L1-like esterase [Allocoleopsis franciscana PCC 7113]|uniref:Lysophospholipase L1-like esterase n=2 Tax=Allocoleopsis TaxID=2886347 RepID=K9WKG0_9CYAN|nr:lysophospholipase L1-like esterase [Allocoleopsis franciscana PCC 7113]
MLAIALVLLRKYDWSMASPVIHSAAATRLLDSKPSDSVPELGPRHLLNYQQWVELLGREADVVARQQPKHLTILAGDSLSLWFPSEILPPERTWLNQGISGETSKGLLNRLALFDKTEPEMIFVMIGINDLIRGITDETILANQELIIRYLRRSHPRSKIVVQSILPHSAESVTWEGRDRLLAIPNPRIRELNERLRAIAKEENVIFLDLYPLFADTDGNLKTELSTDGLHLNPQGYFVWRNALLVLNQLVLEPVAVK